jgi:hypothetical protein
MECNMFTEEDFGECGIIYSHFKTRDMQGFYRTRFEICKHNTDLS